MGRRNFGDFNIDWTQNSFYKNKIESSLNDNGLKQIVKDNTRVTNTSKTINDYAIRNSKNVSVENDYNNKIADYETLKIKIRHEQREKVGKHAKIRSIFKCNVRLYIIFKLSISQPFKISIKL